jgi:glyoxalase family protein
VITLRLISNHWGIGLSSVYGLHHLVSTVSDLSRTVEFYVHVLGMQVLSRTVNLDETSVVQVYCGGQPGSIMSFQYYPDGSRGVPGVGQVSNVAFTIADGMYDFWAQRLSEYGIKAEGNALSFGERHLCFHDPDGMSLSLVAGTPSSLGPGSRSVGRFWSIELVVARLDLTSKLLSYIFGYDRYGSEGALTRFKGYDSSAAIIDVLTAPQYRSGTSGWGIARHLAWRVPDFHSLVKVRQQIAMQGYEITPPLDRYFFNACYFLAAEGLPFAIATDGPGFAP